MIYFHELANDAKVFGLLSKYCIISSKTANFDAKILNQVKFSQI